jgi:hypothetical protein
MGRREAGSPQRRSGWVFSQLHLPRPLDPEQVDAMLLRLAADHAAPPLVFEARAEQGRLVQHLVGTPAEHVRWVQRTLRHLLPRLDIEGITEARLPVQRSVRVRVRPRAFALSTERAELTSASLLSALDARLQDGERLVVQVLLGRRAAPKHLPADVPDPTQPWWQLATHGRSTPRSRCGTRSTPALASTGSPPPSGSAWPRQHPSGDSSS